MAMLDNILGVCKNIQYSSLKSVVQESGLYWTVEYLFISLFTLNIILGGYLRLT